MSKPLTEYIKRIQAMAKVGLTYTENPYDIERYQELKEICESMTLQYTDAKIDQVQSFFSHLDDEYPTPKSDVRAAIFEEGKMLLLKETTDGKWAMPGGWCDIGLTPKENVIKEVYEESGLKVKATRLLAAWDKKCHDHPPSPVSVYKFVFLCEVIGGKLSHGFEATDQGYFSMDNLPELSKERNTEGQIKTLFELAHQPEVPTLFD